MNSEGKEFETVSPTKSILSKKNSGKKYFFWKVLILSASAWIKLSKTCYKTHVELFVEKNFRRKIIATNKSMDNGPRLQRLWFSLKQLKINFFQSSTKTATTTKKYVETCDFEYASIEMVQSVLLSVPITLFMVNDALFCCLNIMSLEHSLAFV